MVLGKRLWWSFIVFTALAAGLAACDSPSPRFSGLAARQVLVDGSRFSVRSTAHEAEAIRLSRELKPERGPTVLKGAKAIVLASGCKLVPGTLDGDTNIVRADIDCPGAAPRPWRRPKPIELDCGVVGDLYQDRSGMVEADFECTVLR